MTPAVLIVDGNRGDIGLISAALEECSAAVELHAAGSVAQALGWIDRRRQRLLPDPSLVVADCFRAPEPHALELLRERLELTPIVVLTAVDDPDHRARSRRAEVAEYHLKPVDWADYQRLVVSLVRRWVRRPSASPRPAPWGRERRQR